MGNGTWRGGGGEEGTGHPQYFRRLTLGLQTGVAWKESTSNGPRPRPQSSRLGTDIRVTVLHNPLPSANYSIIGTCFPGHTSPRQSVL